MDNQLVFLTSTSNSIPSGRNARTIARTSMVRDRTRPTFARGTFTTFSVKCDEEGKKVHPESTSFNLRANERSQVASCWEPATQHHVGDIPRILGPQSIGIEGLLATATARIRRNLSPALRKEPSRVRDVLRRRHWAAASFALGILRLTPEVHSAVEYLEHKVLILDQSGQQYDIGLQKYGVALVELRRSLKDPNRRMQSGVLAASHILAIGEMLNDTPSDDYLKFASGIISLSNLQARKGDRSARLHVRSSSGTILVEALLAKRYDAIIDQPWPQYIISAGDQGHLSLRDAVTLADSADLIFSRPLSDERQVPQMMESHRQGLVMRARHLHSTLKRSIQHESYPSNAAKYACPTAVVLSERVAVMLGLDDFIWQMTEHDEDRAESIHDDNTSFYADIISELQMNFDRGNC